ncbi:type II toxin-antitoxin system VapC family toxin [Nostoc sp. NMS7]|uniref:type II toxin-antitoxin system VapC family toxin n=1 Tax=Nostoc sp. NMS7 TaxID=2815391 RepID=UPI0025E27279|nr:type II toxin-antitoxin system VapC family toxin [Nostoc sp. NMS7]
MQELFNGWVGRLNDPAQTSKLIYLYTKLWETTEFFKVITVFNFGKNAENCYQILRQNSKALAKKKIEKDLRIASIALALDAIRKSHAMYKDFSQIPNLKIKNWEE